MAEHRFVMVIFMSSQNSYDEIATPVLNKAVDWLRFAPNNWLVWTSTSPDRWYLRLKPILKSGDTLLICEVDMSRRSGNMPRSFWDFVKARVSKQADSGS